MNRNGAGLRNIDIDEKGHRQLMLFVEDWARCFTDMSTEDIIVTWLLHTGMHCQNISIE